MSEIKGNIRILIIDDEPSYATMLKMNLERYDYEVKVINNPLEGEEVAAEFQPHIVLLDMIMPGLAGSELFMHFKKNPLLKDIPIILITALASGDQDPQSGAHAKRLTMAKPVKLDKLLEAIQILITPEALTS